MHVSIPDAFNVTREAVEKAMRREPRPEAPPAPTFDEAKLLRLRDKAEDASARYLKVDQRRGEALQRVREIERHIAQVDAYPASTPEAARHHDAQREQQMVKDLERAEAALRRIDERWQQAAQRSRQARAIANRLTEFARSKLGWREPGEQEQHTVTG